MIKDDIISELQCIPETKLTELYELIHSFRLKFSTDSQKTAKHQNLAGCLQEYANGYISTEQAKQQAWQDVVNEKYHRS